MEKELLKKLPQEAQQAVEMVPAIQELVEPPKDNTVRNVGIVVVLVAVLVIANKKFCSK